MIRRARRRVVLVLLLVLGAVAGLLPVDMPLGVGVADPAGARGVGRTPLDDILYWADQQKACGLTRDQLAALMLAPSYPETGAPSEQAPSPMTLSRWDTQAGLYSFAQTGTPYPKAFWHPGVGMWAFDSAGGWNLTAATAISTYTSAQQAATTMAQRWCANPTPKYVWGPWYGCSSSTVCDDIYNAIFGGTSLRNLTIDSAVGRDGGMETRTCSVPTLGTVTCWYVDPSKAQGYAGWAAPAFGPSPVSAPFYVISSGGREYRWWISADTGYPANISADKPVTANARTSLNWVANAKLCDVTVGRGDCAAARVANTPWGSYTALPFGAVDTAVAGPGSLTVGGWAIDPDTNNPIGVHVYVDGTWKGAVTAGQSRPDVAAVVPGYGAAHGFTATYSGIGGGSHLVCVFAINAPPYGDTNPVLGCRTITVDGNPFGTLDSAAPSLNGVRVSGWVIDPDTSGPVTINVYVDGVFARTTAAGTARPDVSAALPGWGAGHGFDLEVVAAAGSHTVCVDGLNVGPGTANPQIGCRGVTIPNGNPFGSLDGATRVAGGIRVSGWAIDPNTSSPISVHIYVAGAFAGASVAGLSRPDVGGAFPSAGPLHGYDVTVLAPASPVTMCAFAINVGVGSTNPPIGCRTL